MAPRSRAHLQKEAKAARHEKRFADREAERDAEVNAAAERVRAVRDAAAAAAKAEERRAWESARKLESFKFDQFFKGSRAAYSSWVSEPVYVPVQRMTPALLASAAPPARASNKRCCFCLGDSDDVTPEWRYLTCGHAYHSACVDKWLTECKSECPTCRAPHMLSITGYLQA